MTATLSSHFSKLAEDTTSLKSTVRPACAHRDLLPQEHSAGAAFLKYLYCFILIKNIYLSLEELKPAQVYSALDTKAVCETSQETVDLPLSLGLQCIQLLLHPSRNKHL